MAMLNVRATLFAHEKYFFHAGIKESSMPSLQGDTTDGAFIIIEKGTDAVTPR